MRILLMQFRSDRVIADQELGLVANYSGRPLEEFAPVDATTVSPGPDMLDGSDAVILGGAGDFLISRDDIPHVRAALRSFFAEARARRIPTLGICFGGQLMTEAFGGKIVHDEARAETGVFPVTKTEAGKDDPLFSYLPTTFDAQLGHKDHFGTIPDGAVLLASSERSPNQAWVFPGEPVYALTFHPELDVEAILQRFEYYAEEYGMTPEARADAAVSLRETPEANELIRRFLNTFVGEDKSVENTVDGKGTEEA